MRKFFISVLFLSLTLAVCGAQGTPTALVYELKIRAAATVNTKLNTKSGNLPQPVATLLPYMSFVYSGAGVTITTRVNGTIAKTVQTKCVPTYNITIISVKPLPTPTVTPTATI